MSKQDSSVDLAQWIIFRLYGELPLCLGFIDYEKVFDSVYTRSVLSFLKKQGIEKIYRDLISTIYKNATSTIRRHKNSDKIKIKKGVCQGDIISPKLFTATLEDIFKTLDCKNKGLKINGAYLNPLRFADGILIFTMCPEELQKIQELREASIKAGLKMNLKNTQIMFNKYTPPQAIEVNVQNQQKSKNGLECLWKIKHGSERVTTLMPQEESLLPMRAASANLQMRNLDPQ
ncbi:UNVERIFIED_CONTAM: hypothetical protein FKN15_011998 [Acipenser sinensis]